MQLCQNRLHRRNAQPTASAIHPHTAFLSDPLAYFIVMVMLAGHPSHTILTLDPLLDSLATLSLATVLALSSYSRLRSSTLACLSPNLCGNSFSFSLCLSRCASIVLTVSILVIRFSSPGLGVRGLNAGADRLAFALPGFRGPGPAVDSGSVCS